MGGVFAWDRDSGMRDTDKDFATMGAGNVAPKGIWSDGEIMWVVDSAKEKAFSYNMPSSSNADLSSLAVDGVEVSDFDFDTTSYVVDVGSAVREVTVSAEVRQLKASITSIIPADSDVQSGGSPGGRQCGSESSGGDSHRGGWDDQELHRHRPKPIAGA